MTDRLELIIETGDVIASEADVLALKYAQSFYGADEAVAKALEKRHISREKLRVEVNEAHLIETNGALLARYVLIVGTPRLSQFGYPEIREWVSQVTSNLRTLAPEARTLLMTSHGIRAHTSLDPLKAFLTEADAILQAAKARLLPAELARITILGREPERTVAFYRELLKAWENDPAVSPMEHDQGFHIALATGPRPQSPSEVAAAIQQVAQNELKAEALPEVFVAMPFLPEAKMQDVYELGIAPAVSKVGYRATRIDHEAFTGDIAAAIKSQIGQAKFIIADLSDNNPNVFLELGFALGRGIPAVLVVKQYSGLPFDVKGIKCLEYQDSVTLLQRRLSSELEGLRLKSII
jgi:hypothetical protein